MTGKDLAIMLSKHGQAPLADALKLSITEISCKLADKQNHGWTLEQLATAMATAGLRVVSQEEAADLVTIPRKELEAINLLAMRYLKRRVDGAGE